MFRNGGLFGGFCAVISAALHRWRRPDPIDVLSIRLRALFPEIGAATSILRRISELAPLPGGRTALAKSISSEVLENYASSTGLETMDFIVQAVDRDFVDNRLVMIEGWMLSETEVRLLAFIAAGRT